MLEKPSPDLSNLPTMIEMTFCQLWSERDKHGMHQQCHEHGQQQDQCIAPDELQVLMLAKECIQACCMYTVAAPASHAAELMRHGRQTVTSCMTSN